MDVLHEALRVVTQHVDGEKEIPFELVLVICTERHGQVEFPIPDL